MLGLISLSTLPKIWGGGRKKNPQSQISKAPKLVSSSGPVPRLPLASFSAGKVPTLAGCTGIAGDVPGQQ